MKIIFSKQYKSKMNKMLDFLAYLFVGSIGATSILLVICAIYSCLTLRIVLGILVFFWLLIKAVERIDS